MRKAFASSLLVLGIGVAACDLTGPKLSEDPNNPTTATNISLFSAVQANLWVQAESDLARTVCVWIQQCAGRVSQYQAVDNYQIGDGDFWFSNWAATYGGGALLDLKLLESQALAAGDSTFAGIGLVVEAWLIGTAADVWGDIPYSQAANPAFSTPVLDPQAQVYTTIQFKLDTAVTYLQASGPTNVGPRTADLVYNGNRGKWRRMAETLKARFYMHTAERIAASYDSVIKYAPLGIRLGDDYNDYHATALPSSNIWFQFFTTAALDYVAAGQFGVNLLQNAGDPRLARYYSPTPANPGIYRGGVAGGSSTDGLTPNTISTLSAIRLLPEFPQPLVTWAEGQLLLAEANLQSPTAPNATTARNLLNNVRATVPMPAVPTGLTPTQLLDSIMIEKYNQEFQTIESWSDYRRTCIPRLVPALPPRVPTRLPYPLSERNANPSIPTPGPDPFNGSNWNDPVLCP